MAKKTFDEQNNKFLNLSITSLLRGVGKPCLISMHLQISTYEKIGKRI